jgi:Zn-dependent protease with chaperone function
MWELTFDRGKVFVFTGILPLCRDEDGIAGVLGHEIAHVVAHHTAYVILPILSAWLTRFREKLSQSPLILVGMGLLLSFDFSLGLSKLLLDAFLAWPASRTQEV